MPLLRARSYRLAFRHSADRSDAFVAMQFQPQPVGNAPFAPMTQMNGVCAERPPMSVDVQRFLGISQPNRPNRVVAVRAAACI